MYRERICLTAMWLVCGILAWIPLAIAVDGMCHEFFATTILLGCMATSFVGIVLVPDVSQLAKSVKDFDRFALHSSGSTLIVIGIVGALCLTWASQDQTLAFVEICLGIVCLSNRKTDAESNKSLVYLDYLKQNTRLDD